MYTLSDRAIDVYNHIVWYYAAFNTMPTAKQIAFAFGDLSTLKVYDAFDKLKRWGWIKRYCAEGTGTMMELTRPTERGLTPAQIRELMGIAK